MGTVGGQQGQQVTLRLNQEQIDALKALNEILSGDATPNAQILQGIDERAFAQQVQMLVSRVPESQRPPQESVSRLVEALTPVVQQMNAVAARGGNRRRRQSQEGNQAGGAASSAVTQALANEPKAHPRDMDRIQRELHKLKVTLLRVSNRLNKGSVDTTVVAEVLYRLERAEQIKVGTEDTAPATERAKEEAMNLERAESAENDSIDFDCTILVIGKAGVGKTETLNQLFNLDEASGAFMDGEQTTGVRTIRAKVENLSVKVVDTPGLTEVPLEVGVNSKILKKARKQCGRKPPNLVFYVDRLDEYAFEESVELPFLKLISSCFNENIWFNALVILTHSAKGPPDGPDGSPMSYDQYVDERTQILQQAIRRASGDERLMNPVALAENSDHCRLNSLNEKILPNGQAWRPQLLTLSFSSKLLTDANKLLKLNNNNKGRGKPPSKQKAPPLPYLLSSLIQSRKPRKIPEMEPQEEEEEEEEENEKAEGEEGGDKTEGVSLQGKEGAGASSKEDTERALEGTNAEEESDRKSEKARRRRRPRRMPMQSPIPPTPATFNNDFSSHKLRFLESASRWVVRPVVDPNGKDATLSIEGFNAEKNGMLQEKNLPAHFGTQMKKDRKDTNVQIESEATLHNLTKEKRLATTAGVDVQAVGSEMATIMRAETRWRNLDTKRVKSKTVAGTSLARVAGSPAYGLKLEERLTPSKWGKVVLSSGLMRANGDQALGGNAEVNMKHSVDGSNPTGTSLSGSYMKWRDDLALGVNVQSQAPLPNESSVTGKFNVNTRNSGQFSLKFSTKERKEFLLPGVLTLLAALYQKIFDTDAEDGD